MVKRVSALEGNYNPGQHGAEGTGVFLREVPELVMWQIAAWPSTVGELGHSIAGTAGIDRAPGPLRSTRATSGAALLRVEPLKWWLIGVIPDPVNAELGAILDISHSRTCISIAGPDAAALIGRHLPLDLRESRFPVGAVASSNFHHVGVTLWRTEEDYRLFLPRGFAVSLWEMLNETAAQFGCEVLAIH